MTQRRVEPLPAADFEFLAAALPEGEAVARVDGSASALTTATAVDDAIRRARTEGQAFTDKQLAGLGVLWGKAVSQASGWTWARIVDQDADHICLVAQDHAHACLPLAFIAEQVESAEESRALLVFEMISKGPLPEANLEELLFVG
ncbi:MAG: hypothetical protein HOW73_41320 [Polyangiaceae bacterium]|nr:hypothetical protein [Polyangiaceae bacterium]